MADFPRHWAPLSPASYVDDLSKVSSMMSSHLHHPNISPMVQRRPDQPPVWLRPGTSLPAGTFGGFNLPVYSYDFLDLVQPQVENLSEMRARVLQIQQNQIMRNRLREIQEYAEQKTLIRNIAARTNGKEGGNNIPPKCGGTGVFLPVPRSATTATKSRRGATNKQPENIEARGVDVEKEDQLPLDVCLPEEWTY